LDCNTINRDNHRNDAIIENADLDEKVSEEELKNICIIPARMGSSRFPGKPLASILGISMIEHVYRRAALCEQLGSVFVATPDEEIRLAVEAFGGKVIMTSHEHERASDRVAEAVQDMGCDIVVMIQGDEPMTTPEMIAMAIEPFVTDSAVQCVNLAKRVETEADQDNPNTIKTVMDQRGNALYFSREPIPTRRKFGFENIPVYKQVCIIPFRRDFLFEYTNLPPTPLEQAESIDMLRILEHGLDVKLVEIENQTHAVDTPADLELVEQLMHDDPYLDSYMDKK